VNLMTKDYRKLNADTSSIVAAFKGIAADCEIQFKLAQLDPNGNCTNGIDRIVSPLTFGASDASKINQWPPNKYYNIWVVHDIGSGAAGYAYLPAAAAGNPSIDGVIIRYDYFGSLAPSSLTTGRAFDHESAHWANLQHTWG